MADMVRPVKLAATILERAMHLQEVQGAYEHGNRGVLEAPLVMVEAAASTMKCAKLSHWANYLEQLSPQSRPSRGPLGRTVRTVLLPRTHPDSEPARLREG